MGKMLYKILFGDFAGSIGTIDSINAVTDLTTFYPVEDNCPCRIIVHVKQLGRLDEKVFYE